ncbi:MAG: TIGR03560 family F420-dependent LLM class oxidoreductase [Dehalococcoidia bacterium]|nr:TIGR03560 family F420-dependent LLM class oxidoreductase [Dehalococcoidia bacterium]
MEPSQRTVKFGIMLPPEHTDYKELIDLWRMVEDLGFDSAWADDHFVPSDFVPPGPRNESWVSLTYLLSHTERIRGGVYVSGNTYRHPAVLAKMATSLDIISNGRLILGIGGAYRKSEHTFYGIPYYTTGERIRQLDEACELITKLWSLKQGEHANFQGKYYSLKDAPFEPQPVQKPHPPIMIGGGGERLTLRVVAKWADWWNLHIRPLREVQHKMDVLRQHCEAVGRNYDDIKKTVGMPLVMTPDHDRGMAIAERMAQRQGIPLEDVLTSNYVGTVDDMKELTQRYIDIGVTYFILPMVPPVRKNDIRRFGEEVIPAFR